MRILGLGRNAPDIVAPAAPQALKDRGILAQWYVLYRLAEEIARARRYHRPLAVLVARPDVLVGECVSDAVLDQTAAAILGTARATDLTGWLARQAILIVLPETTRRAALAGISRWLGEIWLKTQAYGGVPWKVKTLAYPDDFADIGEFQIAVAAFVELEQSEAA